MTVIVQDDFLKLCARATNLYMTAHYIEATDNFGMERRGKNEGVWKEFYEREVAERVKLDPKKSFDFTSALNGYRYRCCLANSNDGWGISMRQLPPSILRIREDLQLDWGIIEPLMKGTGLTLFAGAMNSGKTTTMYSALDKMDKKERGNITTLDDPTEFILPGYGVIQRERNTQFDSFAEAIKDCMRQNRRTIVVSEIRDPETAIAAVLAASTGHKVFGTLHSDSATDTIPRMLTLLDDKHSRLLPGTLRGLWWQNVVRFGDASRKPVTVYESLEVTVAVRQIIQGGPKDLPLLAQEMNQQGRKSMQEIAMSLVSRGLAKREELSEFLAPRGRISEDYAYRR